MDTGAYHFGFIGFGHFAEVIYASLRQAKMVKPGQVLFYKRSHHTAVSKKWGISAVSLEQLLTVSDILFLCVRPQHLTTLFSGFPRNLDLSLKLFISIIAGKKISYFLEKLGPSTQIVRVMPNIPCSIGEGMSVFSFGPEVEEKYHEVARYLFSAMGDLVEIEEKYMDIATALSGSSPAFISLFIDALAKLGQEEGLSYDLALKLVAQSFLGTAKLVQKGQMPGELMEKIAVPGGTTEKGLQVLADRKVAEEIKKAAKATMMASKELSNG